MKKFLGILLLLCLMVSVFPSAIAEWNEETESVEAEGSDRYISYIQEDEMELPIPDEGYIYSNQEDDMELLAPEDRCIYSNQEDDIELPIPEDIMELQIPKNGGEKLTEKSGESLSSSETDANGEERKTLKETYPNLEIITVTTTAKYRKAYYETLYNAIVNNRSSCSILTITTGNDPESIFAVREELFEGVSIVIIIKGDCDWRRDSSFRTKFCNWALKKAISENDTKKEYYLSGFYTGHSCASLGESGKDIDRNDYHYIKDKYETSRETKKQKKAVDKKVKKILSSLNLKGKSTYEKIKKIHDYVIKTLHYNVEESGTAYQALVSKKHTTKCGGYALSMFLLLNEAGIPCHVIGTDDSLGHAWNIVKVNGKWYHLDATFDDGGKSKYGYFLVGSKKVKKDPYSHKYSTSKQTWLKLIKISKEDYKK